MCYIWRRCSIAKNKALFRPHSGANATMSVEAMATKDILVLAVCLAFTASHIRGDPDLTGETVHGVCEVRPNINYEGPEKITGEIRITQSVGFDADHSVEINVDLSGFDPTKNALHGFHVHEYGDLSDGCESAGGHYNPFDKHHGAPTDRNRHVGDLGNVKIDDEGNVKTVIKDGEVSLVGRYSVYGRAFVVHEGVDDLGRGGAEDSLTTGNAGARMACCVIGRSPGPAPE